MERAPVPQSLSILSRWRAKAPLITFALAAMAGIIWADYQKPAAALCLAMAAAGFLGAALSRHSFGFLLATSGLFAMHHTLNLTNFASFPEKERLDRGGRVYADFTGKLGQRVRQKEDQTSSFLFDIHGYSLPGQTGMVLANAKARVSLPDHFAGPGDHIKIRGSLVRPALPENPGELDLRHHWERQGILGMILVPASQPGVVLGKAPNWDPLRLADRAALWVKQTLSRELENSPKERSVVLAMVLGDTSSAEEEILQDFRDTGTMHLFSVSGLHVGMVAVILWMTLMPLGLSRRKVALLVIPLLFAYAFLTGWKPPAVRAAIMSALLLSGVVLNRKALLLNSLALAALLLLAWETRDLFTPGFQLSFCAVLGILLLTPGFRKMTARWTNHDPYLPESLVPDKLRRQLAVRSWLRDSVGTSLAAVLFTLPVSIGEFGSAAPVGLAANIILVPLSFPILVAAFASIMTKAVGLGILSILFNNAGWFLSHLLLLVVNWFSHWPGAGWKFPAFERMHPGQPPSLLILRLPHGGESAILMQDRQNNLVIDTGSEDDAATIIRPALDWLGINQPSAFLLTHADMRHIGGTRLLAEPSDFTPVYPPPHPGRSSADTLLREWLQERPGRNASPFAGDSQMVGPDVRWEVLHPPPGKPASQADDNALVLLIHNAGWRILWLSDSGRLTEAALLAAHQKGEIDLRCDVVIRDHHRVDAGGDFAFIESIDPLLWVQPQESAADNRHLHPFLLRWLSKRGTIFVDPAKTGATLLDFTPQTLSVREWKGRRFLIPKQAP